MPDTPLGTFVCPICGQDTPHHHESPPQPAVSVEQTFEQRAWEALRAVAFIEGRTDYQTYWFGKMRDLLVEYDAEHLRASAAPPADCVLREALTLARSWVVAYPGVSNKHRASVLAGIDAALSAPTAPIREAGEALAADKCHAVSDDAIKHLEIRSPLNRAIYKAIRDYRMSNMGDEDGYPYPLVDLMSDPAPSDIGTGEMEMIALADDVCEAVEAALGEQGETLPTSGSGAVE